MSNSIDACSSGMANLYCLLDVLVIGSLLVFLALLGLFMYLHHRELSKMVVDMNE